METPFRSLLLFHCIALLIVVMSGACGIITTNTSNAQTLVSPAADSVVYTTAPPYTTNASVLHEPEKLTQPENRVETTAITGKLLFVQHGVIWRWSGTHMQPLLGTGNAWQPRWSPDGSQIVFVERGESYSNIMLATAQGEVTSQLTVHDSDLPLQSHERIYDTMWGFYPVWSPGGKRITIASQPGPPIQSPALEYNLGIYSVSASSSGGARRTLLYDEEAHCGSMAYMPFSTNMTDDAENSTNSDNSDNLDIDATITSQDYLLVYTRIGIKPQDVMQLYMVDLMEDPLFGVPFPGAPPNSYDPAFSPDGKWLAFTARQNEATDIWILPSHRNELSPATQPTRLTNMGLARAPAFSPDGNTIAFLAIPPGTASFELWVADVSYPAGGMPTLGTPRQVTHDMSLDADSGVSWGK